MARRGNTKARSRRGRNNAGEGEGIPVTFTAEGGIATTASAAAAAGDAGLGSDESVGMTGELAALAEEAAAGPIGSDAPATVETAKAVTISTEQVASLLAVPVATLGNIACRVARVTPLDPPEIQMLAGAMASLAEAYDLVGALDPRTAAWLNLGIVASTIAMARQRLVEPPSATPAADDPPADDAGNVT